VPLLDKIFAVLKISLQKPRESIKNINISNLRTLIYALKYEEIDQIQDNYKNKLGLNPEKHTIIQTASPKITETIMYNSPSPQKPEKKIRKKDFFNQWDDIYVKQHHEELIQFDRVNRNLHKSIVIIADLNLPQCKKYRVLQKIEILKRKNISCDFSHWLDVPRCLNLMQNASSVLFYRIPYSKLSSSYINEAMRLNINIGYDIDDPIFDKKIYKQNTNINFLKDSEKRQLLDNAIHYVSIIRQCDFITTSTPYLKEVLSKYTNSPIYLWRNLMDSQTLNYTSIANNLFPKRINSDSFILGYMSGSRAHEADFQVIEDVMLTVLKKHKNVELLIHGYADKSRELISKFSKRVTIKPFSEYNHYINTLNSIDLNIVPLVINEFNECKSAIRYLEASILKVPTIMTKVGDFKNIVTHKETGLLINDNKKAEWLGNIEWCINNKSKANKIAENAQHFVLNNYTTLNHSDESLNQNLLEIEI